VNRLIVTVLLIVVAAAAAIAANLALLDYATGGEPVGKLTPRANLPAAPARVVRPVTGTVEHDHGDD
jgi:hypothetical protein